MPAQFEADTVYLRVRMKSHDFIFHTDSGGGQLITGGGSPRGIAY